MAASPECTARWERLLPPTSPEAAADAASWTDSSGNLWLFGGCWLRCQRGLWLDLNDLWEFNPSTNEWAWMGGSSTIPSCASERAVVASPECTARWERLLPETSPEAAIPLRAGPTAAAISGSSGALATMPTAILAISTTFGSSILPRTNGRGWAEAARWRLQPGVYGTLGAPAAGNIPGGRSDASSWTDSSGNFWLFGGLGNDANGGTWASSTTFGSSILPRQSGSSTGGQWAWMGGNNTVASPECTARWERLLPETFPEPRYAAAKLDRQQRQFLALGGGYDANGGYLNDLWEYQPSTSSLPAAATPTFSVPAGTYTTAQTVTISDTTPGRNHLLHHQRNHADHEFDCVRRSDHRLVDRNAGGDCDGSAATPTSAVATAAYTINLPQAATPAFSVAAGTYTSAQTVTISDDNAWAQPSTTPPTEPRRPQVSTLCTAVRSSSRRQKRWRRLRRPAATPKAPWQPPPTPSIFRQPPRQPSAWRPGPITRRRR
jgi:hypothetical protein